MGRNAAQHTSVVVVPSPFMEMAAATTEVAMRTFIGSPFANSIIFLVMGSNRPASSMIEKYRMANRSRMPVFAVVPRPFMTQSPRSVHCEMLPVAISMMSAKTSGIEQRATSGDSFLVMTTNMKTAIMSHPSMVITIIFPSLSLFQ